MHSLTLFASILLYVLLLQLSSIHYVASDSASEAMALLRWKATLHQNQSVLSSWNLTTAAAKTSTTATTPCAWSGVMCNRADDSVVGVNLSGYGVRGTLRTFPFTSLPNLAALDLSFNQLYGIIPPQIIKLSKLTYLDLSTNHLSGPIPPQIGHLKHLEVLHIAHNQLNGSIPSEIGRLKSLAELSLYNNNFNGSIPASLGN